MTLIPQAYRKTEFTHRIGLLSARPSAADVLVGTLYYSSDTGILERSNGVTWDSYGSFSNANRNIVITKSDESEFESNVIVPPPAVIPAYYGGSGTEYTTTLTGNQDDLNFQNAGTLRCNNATLLTIRGLKPGIPGQRLIITSVGAGQVNLLHQNANSTAEDRLINFATVGITSLAVGNGNAIFEYDGITLRWRLISHVQGSGISVPYSAGNFTSDVGTFTVDSGDQETYSYLLNGKFLTVAIIVNTVSVSGNPTELRFAIPAEHISFVSTQGLGTVFDNTGSASVVGISRAASAAAYIGLFRFDVATYQTSTNNSYFRFTLTFEVQ